MQTTPTRHLQFRLRVKMVSRITSVNLPLTITAAQDFTIGLSPTTLTAAPGSSNANFSVSISSVNGFAGSVSVSLTGLPSGTTSSPASPFNVASGASQTVTLSFPTTVQ